MNTPSPASQVKVLAFDVFGTVVDWHGSIVREVSSLGLSVDPVDFATAWRNVKWGLRPPFYLLKLIKDFYHGKYKTNWGGLC